MAQGNSEPPLTFGGKANFGVVFFFLSLFYFFLCGLGEGDRGREEGGSAKTGAEF